MVRVPTRGREAGPRCGPLVDAAAGTGADANTDGLHPAGRGLADAVVLRAETGEALSLSPSRWLAAASAEEQALLHSVEGPVIDLGCGPGRLVLSLARRGVPVLGVDSSPSAIALARRHRAAVLERDVFSRLPGEGRWATALLFDGNIGMGGDPGRLLARCRQLTRGRGRVIVEVEPPGARSRRLRAWLERDGMRSATFAWAVVGADTIATVSGSAGLDVTTMTTTRSGRWFAHLEAAG